MKSLLPSRGRGGSFVEPFRQEMEEFFQRFFQPMEDRSQAAFQAWTPRVDIEESDKEILVKADLPGVDAKDVEVSVVQGTLILHGEKKEEKKEYHRVERFVGQFYREILLPVIADASKITASSSKGVITITIPKKVEVQPRKISVARQD